MIPLDSWCKLVYNERTWKSYACLLLLPCARLQFTETKKNKTMTNLIARKNLFRLSEYFFSLALWWERAGVMPLQKIFFRAWEKCLDTRDKLR
jgi:hypothetical protein